MALASRCDELGYTRYWIAEHHGMANIAASAPEVLIAHIAATTTRMRIGAGGIMLPNHNPLRVVEIFRTLEALHPGRIDLGLGRAPGTDPVTAAALRRGNSDDPNERLAEMLAFADATFPHGHTFGNVIPMPSGVDLPPIWMLGSTRGGASIAASLGTHYAFAGHFAMRNATEAIAWYRDQFSPSVRLKTPYAMLAVTVVCGANDEQAEQMAAPIRLAVVRNRTGRRAPIASIEDALAYRFTKEEEAIADEFLLGAIIGGPQRVLEGLTTLARNSGADELMLSTLLPSREDRLQSYQRISTVAGL
jgi:luciferase family oxidoreductase group 1